MPEKVSLRHPVHTAKARKCAPSRTSTPSMYRVRRGVHEGGCTGRGVHGGCIQGGTLFLMLLLLFYSCFYAFSACFTPFSSFTPPCNYVTFLRYPPENSSEAVHERYEKRVKRHNRHERYTPHEKTEIT